MTRDEIFGPYSDEELKDLVTGYEYFAWVGRREAARDLARGWDDEAAKSLALAREYLDAVLAIEVELFRRGAEGGGAGPELPPAPPESLSDTMFADARR